MRHDDETEARIERDLWDHPNHRRFDWVNEFGNLRTGIFPKKHCVFCAYCTDIFFDASGPYMFICVNDDADTYYGDEGTCWYFEEGEQC